MKGGDASRKLYHRVNCGRKNSTVSHGHPRKQSLCLFLSCHHFSCFYSFQLPKGKWWASELRRLGECRELSLSACCPWLRLLSCFHCLSPPLSWVFSSLHEHLVPGNYFLGLCAYFWPPAGSVSSLGEQGFFCSCLSLDPTPEQGLDPAHIYTRDQPTPVFSHLTHTGWEVVGAAFSLRGRNPWEKLWVTSSCWKVKVGLGLELGPHDLNTVCRPYTGSHLIRSMGFHCLTPLVRHTFLQQLPKGRSPPSSLPAALGLSPS